MTQEVKVSLKILKELRLNGKIATLIRARKGHKCTECGYPIEKGEEYYCVYLGGSGLGNIKFPDRVHKGCINSNLKEVKDGSV